MKQAEGAKGTAGIMHVTVSAQVYSFLLITHRKIKSRKQKTRKQGNTDHYLVESGIVGKVIQGVLIEWKKENEIPITEEIQLRFTWTNTDNSSRKSDGLLESELIGKHDFFHLLECTRISELGCLVEEISQKLKEDRNIRTKELVGVPCVAADFLVAGEYFVGRSNEKAWFEKRDSTPILLDSRNVHALIFIDLKKGLCPSKGPKRRLNLPDFLEMLVHPEQKIPQHIKDKTKESIRGLFLGYGIYELIFLLESPNLKNLFVSVACIRKCFMKKGSPRDTTLARGTSTMVLMPKKSMMQEERDNSSSSSEEIKYSVIVATETGTDLRVTERISEIAEQKLGEKDEIKVYDRQGYYDLIASFKEKSFRKACEIITEIRNIEEVLGTSTIIKVDEKEIEKEFREEKSNVAIQEEAGSDG